jgi:ELWxxDGT repeat protein
MFNHSGSLLMTANGWLSGDRVLMQLDGNPVGLDIQPIGTLIVSESGVQSSQVDVKLTSQPLDSVIVPISISNVREGIASVPQLTFTRENWNIAQRINIAGVDDFIDDSNATFQVSFGPLVTSATEYAGLQSSLTLTNLDNDTAEVIVSNLSSRFVNETGTKSTFAVQLRSQPLGDVTISLSASDQTEALVDRTQVVFTADNWNFPQTVTITGVDDDLDDNDIDLQIGFGITNSTDPLYSGLSLAAVSVRNIDDDYVRATSTLAGESVVWNQKFTYYAASTSEYGRELWRTIGSAAGGMLVADLFPGAESGDVSELTLIGNLLYFVANSPSEGRELRRMNLVSGDISSVIDIAVGERSSDPANLVVVAGQLFFTASDGLGGRDLWLVNTTGVANRIALLGTGEPSDLTSYDNRLFFTLSGINGRELWSSDGTELGTALHSDVRLGSDGSEPKELVVSAGKLYFAANDGTRGVELWVLDSAAGQPRLQTDLQPGARGSDPHSLVAFADGVAFAASNAVAGEELWFSNGITNRQIMDLNLSGDSQPSQLTVVGGTRLFFVADDGIHGRELWESDGTTAGTILREVEPGPDGSNPIGLTALGESLYFAAFDSTNGYELWRSTSPPVLVANLNTGSSSLPEIIGEADGKVFFSAEGGAGERSLFTSSGPGFINALREAGVVFTPTTSMALVEGGTSISYRVKLATQPSHVVTLSISSDQNQISLSTNSLTFNSSNWDQEQLVSLSANNDLIAESALTVDITHTLSSVDAIYGVLGRANLELQLTDNDVAGIVFSPPSTLVTSESGSTTNFSVSLNSQPTANVSFLILSTDTSEGVVSSYQVTFSPLNWNVPQVVTVTGVSDSIRDGDQVYQILTSETASFDGHYNGLSISDLLLTNNDVDSIPLLTVSPVTETEPTTGSKPYAFVVTLSHASTQPISVDFSTVDGTATIATGDYVAVSGSVTFLPYELSKTILVTVLADLANEPDEQFFVNLSNVVDGRLSSSQVTGTILANTVTADQTAPISSIASLPAQATGLLIPITVSGFDPSGPAGSIVSGVKEFRLYVAIGAGAFTQFATATPDDLTTEFLASSNNNYFFRSIAVDHAGNVESKSSIDTQIMVGDFDPPTTEVVSAIANSAGFFNIAVVGQESGGGTLAFFDVYVSIDGEVSQLIGTAGAGSPNAQGNYTASVSYLGRTDGASHSYRFFSIGRDSRGNIEAAPGRNSDIVVTATFSNLQLQSTVSPSSIRFQFSTPMDLSLLNLYDGVDASIDTADITIVGATSGAVSGSIVWDAAANAVTFVKTGAPLASDTYTATLFSRADGFKSATGELLDGDSNGVPGGNYVTTFGVASSTARVVSLPDFARGATSTAGQNVNLSFDNGNPGIPVTISDGTGVLAMDFDIVYNPSLLDLSSSFFGVLPASWTTTVNLVSAGRMRLSLSGTSPLSAGSQIVTRLLATVPANAPYGASDLVRIENLNVYTQTGGNVPIPSIADAGLHKAIFVGDTNADGQYTAQDAGWTSGVIVGTYTGFDAHSWTDPSIVANVNQNSGLDGLDSSWIARKGLFNSLQPEIPNLPSGNIAIMAGIDPTIAAASLIPGPRGQMVTMPLSITDNASGLWGVDATITYDTNRFDLPSGLNAGQVQLAGMFLSESGWTMDTFVDDATGIAKLSIYRATPSTSSQGRFADINFAVKPTAALGETPIVVSGYANVPPFSFSFVSGSIVIAEGVTISANNGTVTGDVLTPLVNSGLWNGAVPSSVNLTASLGSVTKNANGTWDWSFTPSTKLTNQTVTITASDGTATSNATFLINSNVAISNRKVYYKGSSFSQGGSNINAALDPGKVIVRSGATSQTLNYTNLVNTTRGINGIVLDVAGLVASNLTTSDFIFRVSPTGLFNEAANPPSGWAAAPLPSTPIVTPGNETTPARVRLEWADNSIANRWLQIQVLANGNTGLSATQVFYFGHLQGEVNGQVIGGAFFVTTQDQSAVLPLGIATVGVARDLDKNGFITTQDLTAVRTSISAGRTLRVITIPPAGSANEGTAGGGQNLVAGNSFSSDGNARMVAEGEGNLAFPIDVKSFATAIKANTKQDQALEEWRLGIDDLLGVLVNSTTLNVSKPDFDSGPATDLTRDALASLSELATKQKKLESVDAVMADYELGKGFE